MKASCKGRGGWSSPGEGVLVFVAANARRVTEERFWCADRPSAHVVVSCKHAIVSTNAAVEVKSGEVLGFP